MNPMTRFGMLVAASVLAFSAFAAPATAQAEVYIPPPRPVCNQVLNEDICDVAYNVCYAVLAPDLCAKIAEDPDAFIELFAMEQSAALAVTPSGLCNDLLNEDICDVAWNICYVLLAEAWCDKIADEPDAFLALLAASQSEARIPPPAIYLASPSGACNNVLNEDICDVAWNVCAVVLAEQQCRKVADEDTDALLLGLMA